MTLHTEDRQTDVESPPAKQMNVLVLDDSEVDRTTIVRLCEKAGLNCNVTEAETLDAFINRLEDTAFDLIFIDYHLGAHTGLEALEIAVHHPDQTNAAAIMIAGEGQIDIAVEAMRQGCGDYLTKSMLTVDSLQKSIATAIERRAIQEEFATENQARRSLEASVRRYAEASTAEMRQLLAGTLRRVRLMRRHKAGPDYVRDLSTLEIDIDRLWEALPNFRDQVIAETQPRRVKALH